MRGQTGSLFRISIPMWNLPNKFLEVKLLLLVVGGVLSVHRVSKQSLLES